MEIRGWDKIIIIEKLLTSITEGYPGFSQKCAYVNVVID